MNKNQNISIPRLQLVNAFITLLLHAMNQNAFRMNENM